MSLITKYRPTTLEEVCGQESLVKSLKAVLQKKTSRAFLFEGPPGTGKTTTARIIASMVGCEPRNVREIDGATATGIDAMREVTERLIYHAMGGSPAKMIIVDEVQRLSAAAFSSLLKSIEEPPAHTFWALCTTDGAKIPKAIRTRCACYTLNPVPTDDILDLLKSVCEKEGWDTPEEVLYLLAQKAGGSPRQALSTLAQCSDCRTRKAAAAMIHELADETEGIALARALAKGATWEQCMKIVNELGDINPESIRQMVLAYFSKAVKDASADTAAKGLAVLQSFSDPYPSGNNAHCLLLSLGTLLL